jgi:hydroxymethylpyrimidine pyrophosphatase-like HAD family hydrolase
LQAVLEFWSMPIRLIAIDLDGTLLDSRSEVSPANREALTAASALGVTIAVATGRRSHAARKYVRQIPCPVTLISSNGALITSSSGEVLHRNLLSRQVALDVLALTREFRPYAALLFDLPGRGQIVMQDGALPEGPLGWYTRNSADVLQLVGDLEAPLSFDPIQVLFGGPPETIEGVEPFIAESSVAAHVHLTWTKYLARNVSLLDVMTRGCSKGSALARLAEHYGIMPGEVMAIGDNHNDFEMLQFAALPVLMGNRSAGLDGNGWRTTLSNDEDGVAAAIASYVLE